MLQGQRLDEAVVQPGGAERLGFLGNKAAGAACGCGGARGRAARRRARRARGQRRMRSTSGRPASECGRPGIRLRPALAGRAAARWPPRCPGRTAQSQACRVRPGCASRLLSEVGVVIARGVSARACGRIGRLGKATSSGQRSNAGPDLPRSMREFGGGNTAFYCDSHLATRGRRLSRQWRICRTAKKS